MEDKYGKCSCGADLTPVWYTKEEYKTTPNGVMRPTGRVRRAVDHLICPNCFRIRICSR